MKYIGKILCALGLHDLKYERLWIGYFRPHFTCKRKNCNYWKE